MGISLINSKKGRLYLKLIVAAALIAMAVYSYSALASIPLANPYIAVDNATTAKNLTSATATQNLFGYSEFTSENGTTEANSTFKWFKRTLYQPQNLSLVGYWKLDKFRQEYQPQNSSLVGYWKLDGNAADSSANAYHGTVIGATPNQSQNCKIDDCIFFDGLDDYVSIPDSDAFSFTPGKAFTVEAWVYAPVLANDYSAIVGKWDNAVSHPNKEWLFRFAAGRTLELRLIDNATG